MKVVYIGLIFLCIPHIGCAMHSKSSHGSPEQSLLASQVISLQEPGDSLDTMDPSPADFMRDRMESRVRRSSGSSSPVSSLSQSLPPTDNQGSPLARVVSRQTTPRSTKGSPRGTVPINSSLRAHLDTAGAVAAPMSRVGVLLDQIQKQNESVLVKNAILVGMIEALQQQVADLNDRVSAAIHSQSEMYEMLCMIASRQVVEEGGEGDGE